jgi:hypothetical protein
VTSSYGEGIRPSTSGDDIPCNLLPVSRRRAASSPALMRRRTTEQKIAELKTQIDANLQPRSHLTKTLPLVVASRPTTRADTHRFVSCEVRSNSVSELCHIPPETPGKQGDLRGRTSLLAEVVDGNCVRAFW